MGIRELEIGLRINLLINEIINRLEAIKSDDVYIKEDWFGQIICNRR